MSNMRYVVALVCHFAHILVIIHFIYTYHAAFSLPSGLKEADMNIFPMTRLYKDPMLVLEVGYSESLSDLGLNARQWLARTPPVRFFSQVA
jgi:hypothetical protein